jgi:electron transfer flavoprotein alpha subunit
MKNAEGFAFINKLADILGGGVGASRAAIEAGWKPKDHQIGQSGLTVKPPVYLACGISGAVQHTVGMKDSGFIIAINKDNSAAIFNFADLGIVTDGPATIKKLVELLENKES